MDQEIRRAITENLTVSVELAGRAFGLGKNAAYAAAKTGQIPSVRIGGRISVPTAPLRKMLGLDAA
jgi:hypothetical protein